MRVRQPITKVSSMRDGDSYAHVCEKFAVALDEIAAGEGPVKMRLHNAYISSLSHLSEDDLPRTALPRTPVNKGIAHDPPIG
jgi:hypothetical protein